METKGVAGGALRVVGGQYEERAPMDVPLSDPRATTAASKDARALHYAATYRVCAALGTDAKPVRRRSQITWVHRRANEFKKTDHGYNTFTQLDSLQNLICGKNRPSRTEAINALTSLRKTILADLNLVDQNASSRNRKAVGAAQQKYTNLQRKIETMHLQSINALASEAQRAKQEADLSELSMSLFNIDEGVSANATVYNELEELALETNFMKQEELMDI